MTSEARRDLPGWMPTLTAILTSLLWVGYWYWETLEAMAQIWLRSETYTHGLLVPPITLWLIWRDREHLAALQPNTKLWFAYPLAGFAFLWLLADLTAVNALAQFSAIGIIVTATMLLVGIQVGKRLAFPLLFLFFTVPIGDFLLPYLMEWTADFTVLALRLTGIPVYREGQNFVIPSGNWSVVEACSGVRYLIASLTVGTLYAYLTYNSLKRRVTFVVVSLLVPIVANWLRAYMIVMLGHLSGNKLAAGVDHLIYGWIFFGLVILIMFAIGARWADQPPSNPSHTPEPSTPQPRRHLLSITLVLAIVVATAPVYGKRVRESNIDAKVNLSLPSIIGSWQAEPPTLDWQPHFINPTAEAQSAYRNPDGWIGLYIAYYQNQNYERKLVTSSNVLATSDDPTWQIVADRQTTATINSTEVRLREAELLRLHASTDERYLVWRTYWINGHLTSSDIEAKWLTAWMMLTGHGDTNAVIIFYAPKDAAKKLLPDFTAVAGSEILRSLSETTTK